MIIQARLVPHRCNSVRACVCVCVCVCVFVSCWEKFFQRLAHCKAEPRTDLALCVSPTGIDTNDVDMTPFDVCDVTPRFDADAASLDASRDMAALDDDEDVASLSGHLSGGCGT